MPPAKRPSSRAKRPLIRVSRPWTRVRGTGMRDFRPITRVNRPGASASGPGSDERGTRLDVRGQWSRVKGTKTHDGGPRRDAPDRWVHAKGRRPDERVPGTDDSRREDDESGRGIDDKGRSPDHRGSLSRTVARTGDVSATSQVASLAPGSTLAMTFMLPFELAEPGVPRIHHVGHTLAGVDETLSTRPGCSSAGVCKEGGRSATATRDDALPSAVTGSRTRAPSPSRAAAP